MKRIIFIMALLCYNIANAQIKHIDLTASGLTCSMCSKAIYNALLKVKYIDKIDVNIEASTYSISVKNDAPVEIDAIKKAVQDAGFAVASMKITANIPSTTIENDTHLDIAGNTVHFVNVAKKDFSGDLTFKIVDKNYVTIAEHKKYGKFTKLKCYETGYMDSCCPNGKQKAKRVYHATI